MIRLRNSGKLLIIKIAGKWDFLLHPTGISIIVKIALQKVFIIKLMDFNDATRSNKTGLQKLKKEVGLWLQLTDNKCEKVVERK